MLVTGSPTRLQETACAKRESQVTEAFNEMENVIGRLPDFIQRLEGRLNAVLRQPTPQDESAKTAGRPMCVPLVEGLDRYITIVRMANNRLEDILDRLEL